MKRTVIILATLLLALIAITGGAPMAHATDTESTSAAGSPRDLFAMDTCTRGPDEARLDALKAAGYAATNWGLCDAKDLQHAVDTGKTRGIKIVGVYCTAELHRDGLKLDPRIHDAIRIVHGSGTFIWLAISSPDFGLSSADGDAAAAPALKVLAAEAGKQHTRIALYPHTGMWQEKVQDAVRIADRIDSPNLGVTFNLCHCLMVGDEEKIGSLITLAKPRLLAVTINGADTQAARSSWNRLIQPLGKGTYDVGNLIKELDRVHYHGPIGLQGYGLAGSDLDNLTQSREAWIQLLSR